ncbi:MAG: hypothetical protein ABIP74_02050, partial [Candidatus Saccharimonas sp.]
MELSWIQQYALMVLVRQESARVKDLTPRDIPANAFAYHLSGLVGQKLIEKTGRGTYSLTPEGQKIAGHFSTSTNKQSDEIKTVIMFYAKRDEHYLLFRWSRQPYLHQTTLVYDHLPFGTSLHEGLATALADKLHMANASVRFRTAVLVTIRTKGLTVSHMNALIYEVAADALDLPYVGRNGEAFWSNLGESGVMSGVVDTITQLDAA